jgi:hypothetical protein
VKRPLPAGRGSGRGHTGGKGRKDCTDQRDGRGLQRQQPGPVELGPTPARRLPGGRRSGRPDRDRSG